MADQHLDRALLESLKTPPLKRRGFDDRLRARIMHRIEAGTAPAAGRRRLPGFVLALAGLAAVVAVLLIKPDVQPADVAGDAEGAPSGDVEILQAKETAIHAWADGLLLGLRSDREAAAGGRYRTLWIAPEEGRLRLHAEGSGILVPYGLDFWYVNADDAGGGERLYAHKAVSADALASKPAMLHKLGDEPGVRREILVFAGQSYTVLEQAGDGGRQRLLTDLASLSAGKRHRLSPMEIAPLIDKDLADAGANWSVVREGGRWTLRTLRASVPLDERAVVHDGLCVPWADIQAAEPEAVDAFCAPGKSWLAVMTGDVLLALPILDDGSLGGRALEIALSPGETPVLAEWATGGYVAKWTALLGALYGPAGAAGP